MTETPPMVRSPGIATAGYRFHCPTPLPQTVPGRDAPDDTVGPGLSPGSSDCPPTPHRLHDRQPPRAQAPRPSIVRRRALLPAAVVVSVNGSSSFIIRPPPPPPHGCQSQPGGQCLPTWHSGWRRAYTPGCLHRRSASPSIEATDASAPTARGSSIAATSASPTDP